MKNLQIEKKKIARWRLLKILYAARPEGMRDYLVHAVLVDCDLKFTLTGTRQELDFLKDGSLIEAKEVKDEDYGDCWECHITPKGVNVVEYTVDAPDGITRPPQL